MRPRIRTIKPEAHTDEALWDLEVETGLPIFRAFVGLWNFADCEGRIEWRPRALKAGILPYWTGDFADVLDALAGAGFVQRYEVEGKAYGVVRTFTEHQVVNKRERDAGPSCPAPPGPSPDPAPEPSPPTLHVHARAEHVQTPAAHMSARVEGKGREGKGREGDPHASSDVHARAAAPDDRPPMERARSALSRGYGRRYEAATKDPWMGTGKSGQAIGQVAAWCAASDPEQPERAAELVLVGMFADPWMSGTDERGRHRRWPWGAVANDPAKYADAGRIERAKAGKAKRRAAAEAKREAEERERVEATAREATPPPAEAKRLIAALTGGVGGTHAGRGERASEREARREAEDRDERRQELERQAEQLRAAGGGT